MSAVVLILLSVAALLALGVAGLAVPRAATATRLVYGGTGLVCLSAASLAFAVLATGAAPDEVTLPLGLPWIGAVFRLDSLSAFFLLVIDLGGALSALYGIGHGAHEKEPARVLPFFPAFLAGMNLVLLSADAFSFLLSWEFMSLASWALVMAHGGAENRRAGYVYIVMASLGTMALLMAFGILAGPVGGFAFEAMRHSAHAPQMVALVVILALLGTGSKAGLVPLHAWLPLAHPAAPSHVSALMSGVMTKVAVYGFIRILFDLCGGLPWWAGLLVLIVGGISAALGVLQAVMQDEMKRLLAFSTIENIGIVFVGLGLALAFRGNGMQAAAALALTAALFHVLNHSFFKSLLFFGAGAVLTATGERGMDRLGGLIHRMPATALFFLLGCMAISALPPLNGFVSEWLTFQAILASPDLPGWGLKIGVPAVGGLLALAAALAAAAFVKAFGIAFLGRARSEPAKAAREVDRFSLAAMAVLGFLCLAAGVFPGLVIDLLAPAVRQAVGEALPAQAGLPWLMIMPSPASGGSYDGALVFLFMATSGLMAAAFIHRFASRKLRRAPAWDCGFPEPSPATQYSGSGFAQPIRRVFAGRILGASEEVAMPAPGDMNPARFTLVVPDPVWDRLYLPVAGAVQYAARELNRLQFLTIRRYLGLVFAALILLLLVIALWS